MSCIVVLRTTRVYVFGYYIEYKISYILYLISYILWFTPPIVHS